MKKLFLLFLALIPSWIFACMPPSPWEVMIARISSIDQTQSGTVNIGFSSFEFPFKDYTDTNPTSWHWQNYSNTSYPWFWTWELIIALSDYQDGSYPMHHSIFHMTTLSCESNTIKLGKKYGTIMWWDRKNGRCGYEAKSLLDVFIEDDESAWIKKLQEKYPTCDDLQKTFPVRQEISPKSTETPSLKNDVIVHSTWFLWIDWILSKIDTFFGLF
jgi:hypothetical protein